MRLAAIQCDIAWQDPARSRAGVECLLDAAALPPGSVALLPELFDVGFSLDLEAITPNDAPAWASRQARQRQITLAVGAPRRASDGMGRNECTIAHPDGTLSPAYEKVHPYSAGRENEAYRGGRALVLSQVGPQSGAFTACPLICYDLRFPELWRAAAIEGADLFLIGASWPAKRQHHWRALVIARAIENQAFVVAANRVGQDPTIAYAGGSMIVAPTGEVLAEAGAEPSVISAECDPAAATAWRSAFPALRDLHRSLLGSIDIVRG